MISIIVLTITITHPRVLTSAIAMVISEMSKTVYVEVIGFFPAISCKMIVKTMTMLIDCTYIFPRALLTVIEMVMDEKLMMV